MRVYSREIAWAAAWDSGNASMRAGKRRIWSEEDLKVARITFACLWPGEPEGEE